MATAIKDTRELPEGTAYGRGPQHSDPARRWVS